MEQLKDLYFKYFSNGKEYSRLDIMPEVEKAREEAITFIGDSIAAGEVILSLQVLCGMWHY